MGSFNPGEIVLFPFPYTNLRGRKLRPCLILSKEMGQDIILCQITSKYTPADKFSIELNKKETLFGTLNLDSRIRCNMIFTASTNQILKILCKLSKEKYSEVVEKIIEIISCHNSK